MGVKGVIYFISILMFFSSAVYAEDGGLPSEDTLNARGDLKDYALINCLIAIDPNSVLSEDLKLSKRALSFMGKGVHMVIQNEDTLDTEYDPYAEAASFLLGDSAKLVGHMKNGETSKSYGCLKSYRSDKFNTFIIKQDAFISVK